MERYEEVLEYWFEGIDEDTVVEPGSDLMKKWFKPTPAQDAELKKLFSADVQSAAKGEYKSWEDDPYSRLALVIILDQFSRQVYRGTPQAFENDIPALELGLRSLKDGFDGRVSFVERIFYYLPLMHSENKEVQVTSVETFERHLREAERYEDPNIELFKMNLDYAIKHRDVIFQFNRFPQRNDAMGRRSTSDERAFLQEPVNQF